ncbi:hypothetical protein ACLBXI_27865 [Bacillus cereus]
MGDIRVRKQAFLNKFRRLGAKKVDLYVENKMYLSFGATHIEAFFTKKKIYIDMYF